MSFATKYTLKPTLKEKFKGIIWKIETDALNHVIAIETRDPENREAFFSAFDFSTGKTLFKEISVDDSWNWGLEKTVEKTFFLHSYINDKTPEHKGIIALNGEGKISWAAYNKALEAIAVEGLIAYNPSVQQKQLELLKPATGEVIKNRIINYTLLPKEIYFPQILPSESPLRTGINESITGPVFYIHYNDKDCISFHSLVNEIISQQLIIKQGDSIFHREILEQNIQKINPEPFFIEQNHLFCIRDNKREIVTYLV